ncbi:hypothetical protein [Arcicella rigui]|uniref:Outer membrane protein beta-barrel domain-containing protein n=1 Tax=Arcicella rigui TaxID=797020 RepID=A0ABU5Q537_9BACT|nr:hypothetical protein [Arcicella rigui]MEA5137935.1 hypothetical protein [Arcicella rigui]
MKKLLSTTLYIVLAFLTLNTVTAQRRNSSGPAATKTTKPTKAKEKEVVDENNYHSILSFGITTNTNSGLLGGFAAKKEIVINSGSSLHQLHYFGLELVNVNHPKQSSVNVGGNGSSYTYGKQNYLFAIRPQYGREFNLFHRSSDGGVSVSGIIAGGPTIGLEKPYYLQIYYGRGIFRDEVYDPNKHNVTNIAGTGGFFEGLGNSKIVPGANIKAALNFELDAFRQSNISLEIGFLAEIYQRNINIMSFAENQKVFTSGYLTLYFGGKN